MFFGPPLLFPSLVFAATQGVPDAFPPRADSVAALAANRNGFVTETLPGQFLLAALPEKSRAEPATDPFYSQSLPYALALYQISPSGNLSRRLTVRFSRNDRDDAFRAGRLCARLMALHAARFGRETAFPRGATDATIWLVPENASAMNAGAATVGGQTRTNQVYIFDTKTPRAKLEWARTLAHEWGHLTLNAARGFSAPETDAGGELGERLFLWWLREENLDGADLFADKDNLTKYFATRIGRLLAEPDPPKPDGPALSGADETAFFRYVGGLLRARLAFGDPIFGRALVGIDDETPGEFFQSLKRATVVQKSLTVRLPAWVFLGDDTYRVSPAPGGGSGKIAIDQKPAFPAAGGAPFSIKAPGWKWMRSASGNLTAITLTKGAR